MEQAQEQPSLAGGLDQRQLRVVERPVGGEVAAVLVGIGVAQHDLLDIPATRHVVAVQRQLPELAHDVRTTGKVVDGLEQRDDVHGSLRVLAVRLDQPDFL